jgi:hypothetical protein
VLGTLRRLRAALTCCMSPFWASRLSAPTVLIDESALSVRSVPSKER